MDFPALNSSPSVANWNEEAAQDPTLRSKKEGGYTQTRPRFTRVPWKWRLSYPLLSAADKAVLVAFEKSVGVGSQMFQWLNPMDEVTYSVRLAAPIKYRPRKIKAYWVAELELEEV